jgi:hypothetical protein
MPNMQTEQVGGKPIPGMVQAALSASAALFKPKSKPSPQTDRNQIAKAWQVEAYRQVKICGEARYAAVQYSAMAGRAEIGVSQPDALARKAVWVKEGPEVDAFATIAPTVRERSKMTRDFMLHRVIAGECYLVARTRQKTDPGYIVPPEGFDTWADWEKAHISQIDPLDPSYDPSEMSGDPNLPIWEMVAVTEIRKKGDGEWEVRHDNQNWIALSPTDPVIRMWNPDPEERREAWSPFLSMASTLKEIEWLTAHIFTQVRSRLMSAGVWFLPENLTYPPPPPDAVEGGAEAIAAMNEAEKFMMSLAASSMQALDMDEVSFPSVIMADPAALAAIDKNKLIQFWSDIDDKAMILRSSAIRRFALGFDMVPEKMLGSSGIAVDGAGGSAGSVNHWGVWANEEQTISNDIEPGLDEFVGTLTTAVLRTMVEGTSLVIAYNSTSMRLKKDLSEEAIQLYDRGLLKGEVTVREVGFDPEHDMMDENEFRRWILVMLAKGSATPEMVNAALTLLGAPLGLAPAEVSGNQPVAPGKPGRNAPGNLDGIEQQGPPQVQHDQTKAPYAAVVASCEVLVLRALEKSGNRLLNNGKRGKDRDRLTPPHLAHLSTSVGHTASPAEFDFSLVPMVLDEQPAVRQDAITRALSRFCADLYNQGEGYTREGLIQALEEVA